ncbi:MAG: hypothetical protein U0V74_10190 [Chitinophagales bacterium]
MVIKVNEGALANTQKLWRYISFSKFVSLLHSRKLYFTRADKFIDTYESSIPQKDVEAARNYYASFLDSEMINVAGISQFPKTDIRPNIQHFLNLSDAEINAISDEEIPRYLLKTANRYQYVSCWHTNNDESAGMWQIYMNNNEGVAIQTTPQLLAECLQPDANTIYLGPVNYIDYTNDSWGPPQALNPIFHKRNSFAHEREVRAVIINPKGIDPRYNTGAPVEIDLEKLIQQVFVSPQAESWFKDTVQSVCNQYGLSVKAVQSGLYNEPSF